MNKLRILLMVAVLHCFVSNLSAQNAKEIYEQGVKLFSKQDYYLAFVSFETAADKGSIEAKSELGWCYLYGYGTEKDEKKAFDYFNEAAEKGNAKAQYQLARCYDLGLGCDKNVAKSIEWVQKAVRQNYANAQYFIAWSYEYGDGVEKNPVKASELYKKSLKGMEKLAEKGDLDAMCNLGTCYLNGYSVEVDSLKALEWFNKAAEADYVRGYDRLGWYYFSLQPNPDYANAVENFSKAAEMNYASSQYCLGFIYANGYGVEKNEIKSFNLYKKAAEQGNVYAQSELGDFYFYGSCVEQNYGEAVKWYEKAAEQGNSRAQKDLGFCYEYGYGIGQSYEEAVKWYELAAEQGEIVAQANLGYCYANGCGVNRSYNEAVYWYKLAAEQGLIRAQNWLGNYYENSNEYTEAEKWYKKAAEQDNIEAQSALARCYYTVGDLHNAILYWNKAAEKGDAESQLFLGFCYEAVQDYETAVMWYSKSSNQGNSYALFELGETYFYGRKGENYTIGKNDTIAIDYYQKSAEKGNDKAIFRLVKGYLLGEFISGRQIDSAISYAERLDSDGFNGFIKEFDRHDSTSNSDNNTIAEKEYSILEQKKDSTILAWKYLLGYEVNHNIDSALICAESAAQFFLEEPYTYSPAIFLAGLCNDIKGDLIEDSIDGLALSEDFHTYKHKAFLYYDKYICEDNLNKNLKGYVLRRKAIAYGNSFQLIYPKVDENVEADDVIGLFFEPMEEYYTNLAAYKYGNIKAEVYLKEINSFDGSVLFETDILQKKETKTANPQGQK